MDMYRELSDKMTRHRVVSFLSHLRKNDLTMNQYKILSLIEQQGPWLPNRLAEHMELKAATITYLVDALEQRGLVIRTPNPSDGRSHYVNFTAEGRQLVLDARSEGTMPSWNPSSSWMRTRRITCIFCCDCLAESYFQQSKRYETEVILPPVL